MAWRGVAAIVSACGGAWLIARRWRDARVPRVTRYRREVHVACAAARTCGRAMLRAGAGAKHATTWKDACGIDPCTVTDRENEECVRRAIARAFPTHALIGEETASVGVLPALDDAPTWIVDPIDGTQNFVHGLPMSVVSIGLCVRQTPVLGVVYDPHADELIVAVRDEGAGCNGERFRCACAGVPVARALSEALVITDPAYERSEVGVRQLAALYLGLLEAGTRAVRVVGSSVLAITLVARGRASGFVIGVNDGDSPKPWDWCAAAVIAREAGAILRMVDARRSPPGDETRPAGGGDSFDLYSRSGVCATSRDVADALQTIALRAIDEPVVAAPTF